MNTSSLVSILLPVYNAEPHLRFAVESMLCQTYQNFELIILEDGSTDNSLQYLNGLQDVRIKLISDGINRGLTYRLNQGISEAKGKYVCRMDADDISTPDRLRLQIDFLDAHPEVDLVGGRAIAFQNSNQIIGMLPFAFTHEELCARPWNRIPIPHPTWMVRREWYLKHPYTTPEVFRAEDQDLLLEAYTQSRYSCIADVVLAYRVGKINVRKTLMARISLIRTQVKLFYRRKQFSYLIFAVTTTILKTSLDILTVIPGIGYLVLKFRTGKLNSDVIRLIDNLLLSSKR